MRLPAALAAVSLVFLASVLSAGEPTTSDAVAAVPAASGDDSTLDEALDAAGADGDAPRRELVSFNHYESPYFSIRVGGGFLYDVVGYSQDGDSKDQMVLRPENTLRDLRFLAKGHLLSERLTYTVGYMYDQVTETWRFRQTGIGIDLPELWGSLFVGRTKEGVSMNKIMVGYQGFTMERATANDSFVPILADGVKWQGYVPSGKFLWSFGWFYDELSERESFNKFDSQYTVRAVWLPWMTRSADGKLRTGERLLHLGIAAHFADANDGFLQFRSKPESFPAQSYAIDTGRFPADDTTLVAFEAYYRDGPWVLGSEYFLNQVDSGQHDDPFFHGGRSRARLPGHR